VAEKMNCEAVDDPQGLNGKNSEPKGIALRVLGEVTVRNLPKMFQLDRLLGDSCAISKKFVDALPPGGTGKDGFICQLLIKLPGGFRTISDVDYGRPLSVDTRVSRTMSTTHATKLSLGIFSFFFLAQRFSRDGEGSQIGE
jgi:hypothetical protein